MLLSLNGEFVRLGFDRRQTNTFILLAVSPAQPSAEFFLRLSCELGQEQAASGVISVLDLTKVMGQQDLLSCPRRSVRTSPSLMTFTSTNLSSGSSKPEGLSWTAKAHFSLAQARLGGHCISALFVKGCGAAAVLWGGWDWQ